MKLSIPITRSRGVTLAFFLLCIALYLTPSHAQQAPTATQKQAAGAGPVNFTAKSANVAESGIPVKINIFRWSTDEERNPVVAALDPAAQAAAQAAAAAGGQGGRGGRGGRGGGRGDQGAAAGLDPNDPALADLVAAGQGARGGRGRGGRGDGTAGKPADPITTLTGALSKAPTVGFLWTSEVVGYSIKYAYRTALPDGGERIILLTDRRLGGGTSGWKPAGTGTPTDYEFTLIELRIDPKGLGEGKTSLTSKVVFDKDAKTVALDNYVATAPILTNVKR
jgi:hypothetical protein